MSPTPSAAALAVGFVGLGRMGWPMASQVAQAGFAMFVHNRTEDRSRAFAEAHPRATVCRSPAEVASTCDVIVTMLADGTAVNDVFLGKDGLLEGERDGVVFVEMSTIGPEHTRRLAEAIALSGNTMVDAPVSGSVQTATSGGLLVMAGGDAASIERVKPVLDAIGRSVVHVGGPGAGALMKLVVNTVIYGLNQSLSEALVLAERSGLDRLHTYEVFAGSAIAAPFVHYRREAFERPGEVPAAFRVELAAKDLRLILTLGREVGADLRQAETNLAILEETEGAGFRDDDVSAVARYLRDKNRAPPTGVPERGG